MNYFKNGTFGFILLLVSTLLVGQQQYEIPEGYILTQGNNMYRAKQSDLSLQIGATQHGVGFVLRF